MSRSIVPPPLPPLISPGVAGLATAVVSLLMAGANWSSYNFHDGRNGPAPTEQVRYLLPLLPARVPVKAVDIDWVPPDLSRIPGGDAANSGGRGNGGQHEIDDGAGAPVRPI